MPRNKSKFLMLALLIAFVTHFIAPNIADAKRDAKYHKKQIRIESGYGNGIKHASVRYRNGSKEVRGPGGTWVSCFGGCENAYREEFLDFWETIDENSD